MKWLDKQKQDFYAGKHMLWRDGGDRSCTLCVIADQGYWQVSLDRQHQISWVMDQPASEAPRFLPTELDARDHVIAPEAIPESLGTRLLRVIDELPTLEAKYESGEAWIPVGNYYVVKHPVLGRLLINPVTQRISERLHPLSDFTKWLWDHPGEFPGKLPQDQYELISPKLTAYTRVIESLRTEDVLLTFGQHHRGLAMFSHDRFLHLRSLEPPALDELIFNPYASAMKLERVVEWLFESAGHTLSPLPDVLRSLKDKLTLEFSRPKEEIVEKYVQRIRKGGYISGGPTTDQSWTIRYSGGGFTISGYQSTNDGGYEQTLSPISEDEVRRMIVNVARLS